MNTIPKILMLTISALIVSSLSLNYITLSESPLVAFAAEHGDIAGHEDHGGHEGHHDEEKIVKLTSDEIREFGIEIKTAAAGNLSIFINLPGEVRPNADRLAHIVPRISGIVSKVQKKLGDKVMAGDVMAELESRELADAKSIFLAARERVILAKANYKREEKLWKKKISPERNYLKSKQVLAEKNIELRVSEQKLQALGFSKNTLKALHNQEDATLTRYKITAPFTGTVIEKHITLGEVLKDDSEAFVIVDLSSVWIDLSVYQKDLPYIKKGQPVIISAGHSIPDITGEISYIGTIVGEKTRAALARVEAINEGGQWRPGLFVTCKVAVENKMVSLLVPKSAMQIIENKKVIFVQTEKGFEPKEIVTGEEDELNIEIRSGLKAGERFVASGAFTLKTQLAKSSFDSGHHH